MNTSEIKYYYSVGKSLVFLPFVIVLSFAAFVIGGSTGFIVALLGFLLFLYLLYFQCGVVISSEEITVKGLLSSKSLKWNEISCVYPQWNSLKLENRNGSENLLLDSQLNGYADILDLLFKRRPDLFGADERAILSCSMFQNIFAVGLRLLLTFFPVYVFAIGSASTFFRIYSLIIMVLGLRVLVSWFSEPQGIILEKQILTLRYFFKQESLEANKIKNISLKEEWTKLGYDYLMQINLQNGKALNLPTFKEGKIFSYCILKQWYEKAVLKQ